MTFLKTIFSCMFLEQSSNQGIKGGRAVAFIVPNITFIGFNDFDTQVELWLQSGVLRFEDVVKPNLAATFLKQEHGTPQTNQHTSIKGVSIKWL